jgi:nucleoside-diphosphate-sugar epimerase
MARIVVTGGAGFLGSHLVDSLLARGDEVIALDNLLTGREENLAGARDHARFTFIRCDVAHEVPVDGAVDAVMHFASAASPPRYLEHPIETLEAGSLGTRLTLELARANRCRYVLASTSEIYGDPLVHPQPEDYWGNVNPCGVRSVYDEAKRFAEALTMAYCRTFGLSVGIVRIFNTYGPRLQPADGRVVSNLLLQAMQGGPLTIYGDGTQTRSFCYVDDEVRGILALLDADVTGPINIGNADELTVLELAKTIVEITGSTSEIVFQPLPADDPAQRRPDLTRARELLHWQPAVPLIAGLQYTHDWYRAMGSASATR